jgi:LAO/AO transport system kinase
MKSEIEALLRERVLRDLANRLDRECLDAVVSRVVDKQLDPYAAVDVLLDRQTAP